MSEQYPSSIGDVITPCLLVDIDKVKKNCQKMIDIAKRMGVELRPHMKTHKTIEGGVLATGGSKRKIVVSTLDEAEFYAANGFDDILWARPLSKSMISRCQNLANQLNQFHVLFEDLQAIQWLQEAPLDPGKKWSAFLEVDTGYGRTGACWDEDTFIALGKAARDATNVTFMGIYTHCGGSYDCHNVEELKSYGTENAKRLLSMKTRLETAGVPCPTTGTGSTPSCSQPSDNMASITEFHPGNYIFYDLEHVGTGACTLDEVAVRVATRVISHKPSKQQLAVDCGFTGLSEAGCVQKGDKFCHVQDYPELRLTKMSQEIGEIVPAEGNMDFDKHPLGSMLFLYPHHSCATAAMHPIYYVHSGDKIVGIWKPTRGW